MATGYTMKIKDGQTFNEFVLTCARAMGACIMMRDDPMDAPIKHFEPSDWNLKEKIKAEKRLSLLSTMTLEKAEKEAQNDYDNIVAHNKKMFNENNDLKLKYESMLIKVEAWIPPTPDHEEFKEFMIQQINSSIDFDCNTDYYKNPPKLSGEEWLKEKIAEEKHNIKYHNKEYNEEVKRTEGRNKWVEELIQSI